MPLVLGGQRLPHRALGVQLRHGSWLWVTEHAESSCPSPDPSLVCCGLRTGPGQGSSLLLNVHPAPPPPSPKEDSRKDNRSTAGQGVWCPHHLSALSLCVPQQGSLYCPCPSLTLSSAPEEPTPGRYRCKPEKHPGGVAGGSLRGCLLLTVLREQSWGSQKMVSRVPLPFQLPVGTWHLMGTL